MFALSSPPLVRLRPPLLPRLDEPVFLVSRFDALGFAVSTPAEVLVSDFLAVFTLLPDFVLLLGLLR
jgi:hypothetical protein